MKSGYRLTTRDGDVWHYTKEQLENARFDQYIFGGKIEVIDDETLA